MTYQIKCNGIPLGIPLPRKEAVETLGGLQTRAMSEGLGTRLTSAVGISIEYSLSISNGLKYEMRMV